MGRRVLIKNGHIVDPKQNFDQVMNLYIENGKIVNLTEEEPDADLVIDAAGKIVCPGFIDIHMHEDEYDAQTDTIETGMAESALRMGVTLDIAEMQDTAQECLEKGCLGISFGVKYVPGTTWEEILALIQLCRKDDKLVTSHVRKDVDGVFDAADELARMGQEGRVKVQFSHIGSMGGYGQMKQLLSNIEGYRAMGIDMLCDCYPYEAFSTEIGATTYDEGFLESYQSDYDSILIVNGKYSGQRCTKEIFDELRETAPDTGTVGYFMKKEDVEMALLSPLVMIGSDGIRMEGKGHPRASGSFAKFIREYMATGRLSLLEGVRKISTMAADRLRLPQKGNFLPGSDADVVIFDLNRVTDRATFEDGQIPSEGFDWVLIGGRVALQNDRIINNRLGRSVRR